jgi:HEAT repeat protein
VYSVKVKLCFLATSFFICACAFSCISSTDAYINTNEYPPIKHNIGKEVHQKEKFPQPYASRIESEIEKVPWYGTRHTGWCGTGMDAGQRKFAEILTEASTEDVIKFLEHQAVYVRGGAHEVIITRKDEDLDKIAYAFENGSSRIKLELFRYIEPDAPDDRKFELIDEIIHNPELRVFKSDLRYLQTSATRKHRGYFNQNSPENYPIDIIGFYVRLLEDHFNLDRSYAFSAITRFGPKAQKAIPALLKMLEIDDVEYLDASWQMDIAHSQKTLVAIALGSIGSADPEVITKLEELKTDKRLEVACHAASALYKIGEQKQVQLDFILEKFNSVDSPTILPGICESLWFIGSDAKAAIPKLEKLIAHEDHSVKWMADRTLETIEGKEKALQRDMDNLDHENPEVRQDSIRDLERHIDKSHVRKALLKIIEYDMNPDVVYSACSALKGADKVSEQQLLKGWIRILELGGQGQMGASPVYSIKDMGSDASSALPALLKFLCTKRNSYPDSAIEAILAVGGDYDSIVKRLIEVIENDDDNNVKRAMYALAKIKGNAVDALPVLLDKYEAASINLQDGWESDASSMEQASLRAMNSIIRKVDIDTEISVDCLMKLVLVKDKNLSDMAFSALKNYDVDYTFIVDTFIKRLDNANPNDQKSIISKFGEIGEDSFPVIPILLEKFEIYKVDPTINKIVMSLEPGKEYDNSILMQTIYGKYNVKKDIVDKILELGVPLDDVILNLSKLVGKDVTCSSSAWKILAEYGERSAIALPFFRSQYQYDDDHGGAYYQRGSNHIVKILESIKPDSNISIKDLLRMMDCNAKEIVEAAINAVIIKGGLYDDIAIHLANNALGDNIQTSIMASLKLSEHYKHCAKALLILRNFDYSRDAKWASANHFVNIAVNSIIKGLDDDSVVSVSELMTFFESDKIQVLLASDAIARITGSYDSAAIRLAEVADSDNLIFRNNALWALRVIAGNAKAALPKLRQIKSRSEMSMDSLNSVIKEIENGVIRTIEEVMEKRMNEATYSSFTRREWPIGILGVTFMGNSKTDKLYFNTFVVSVHFPMDDNLEERLLDLSSWKFAYVDDSKFPSIKSIEKKGNRIGRFSELIFVLESLLTPEKKGVASVKLVLSIYYAVIPYLYCVYSLGWDSPLFLLNLNSTHTIY